MIERVEQSAGHVIQPFGVEIVRVHVFAGGIERGLRVVFGFAARGALRRRDRVGREGHEIFSFGSFGNALCQGMFGKNLYACCTGKQSLFRGGTQGD